MKEGNMMYNISKEKKYSEKTVRDKGLYWVGEKGYFKQCTSGT